jgi:hypothetical protein
MRKPMADRDALRGLKPDLLDVRGLRPGGPSMKVPGAAE